MQEEENPVGGGYGSPKATSRTSRLYSARNQNSFREMLASARPLTGTTRMKFHFFSFQIHGTTGYRGFS